MSRTLSFAAFTLALFACAPPLAAQQAEEELSFGETVSEAIGGGNPNLSAEQVAMAVPRRAAPRASGVYYAGCDQVRAAGKAPLYRGEPGYREGMDGDLDGVACEPYYGQRSYSRFPSRRRR